MGEGSQYIYGVPSVEVAAAIDGWRPRTVSGAVACFARALVHRASPTSTARAKALLFAASKLGVFCTSLGLELDAAVCLHPSVIERFVASGCGALTPATRRTLRTNLHALRRTLEATRPPAALARERAKAPYCPKEIAAYLALADAQPTTRRRRHAVALVCLGAGAGLMGEDLRGVRGTDVAVRSGGVVVVVKGRRPRVVPVRACLAERLLAVAEGSGDNLLIGGVDPMRHNVTSSLTASLAGGDDLPRIELGRLRATWLVAVAEVIGLKAFMDAAGITCSQRLGDLVATLAASDEESAVALLGGRR